jgi:hypothetical protein
MIVEVASERQWIIVTANEDDFIKEINKYLRQTKKLECHDLSGLVILPSDYEVQRNALRPLDGGWQSRETTSRQKRRLFKSIPARSLAGNGNEFNAQFQQWFAASIKEAATLLDRASKRA